MTTKNSKSEQVAVRVHNDVLNWIKKKKGRCRGVATMINAILRDAFEADSENQKKGRCK